ncbi:MAG: hypothetical protein HN975_09035 [Anaerolineae bacterium]|jgi:hypothetical protein|nr:hypothetical protein [Anaerolineae bacterium]
MESRRFGCLSMTGIISAALTLVMIVGITIVRGGVLFSPGTLSAQTGAETWGGVQSHAEIQGDCAACHVAPWSSETMKDRCTACHLDLKEQFQDPESLHSLLFIDNTLLTCIDCHPDHRGADASLTVLDANRFPHDSAGFSLNAHQKTSTGEFFVCSDCHETDITKFEANACERCHRDIDAVFTQVHIETFSHECLACHDGVDTYGSSFNHNAVVFPLEGKHAEATCSKCHLGASSLGELQSTPQECFACHQEEDKHNGEFGENCAVCHASSDWEEAIFDHTLSNFPLEGEHANIACEDCHKNAVYEGTLSACVDCHLEDDEHKGEFGTDCSQCHTTSNWEGAAYDHTLANFPLEGGHANVKCEECHINQVFQGISQECSDCHREPVYHAGSFSADCASCHTILAWIPAKYTEQHTFPMNHESDGNNSCQTCHVENLETYTCYECHEHTPSNVASEHREEGISDFEDCMECHADGREHDD